MAIKNICEDEDEYLGWKATYINEEYEKLEDKKFITCEYFFIGYGSYSATIPEEQKASFLCWIDGNGSAFFAGEHEASEEEVKNYIALQAATGIQF